jgi:hypothetical protein
LALNFFWRTRSNIFFKGKIEIWWGGGSKIESWGGK